MRMSSDSSNVRNPAGGESRLHVARVRMKRFSRERRIPYAVLVAAISFTLDFVLLQVFLAVPEFNERTLLCPAGGIGPVLGLFFGIPGIAGCAAAAALSDLLAGAAPFAFAVRLLTNTACIASFHVLWFVVSRERPDPFARLDGTGKILRYVVLAVAAAFVSVLAKGLEDEVLHRSVPVMRYVTLALNNFVFLIYLGMPLLILLNRLPFYPFVPRWVDAGVRVGRLSPYSKAARTNLTQRMIVAGLAATVGVIFILNFLYFIPYPFYQDYYSIMPDAISGAYALSVIFTFIILGPTLAGLRYLESHYTVPIESVTGALEDFVGQVRTGATAAVAEVDVADAKPLNEVQDLVRASTQLQRDLVEHIDRLGAVLAERERVATELDVARRIQMSVIPHDFDAWRSSCNLDIYGFMHPAREVGGDFYDVLDLGEGRVGFIIGDVSGKGVPAALFMMRALNELRLQMRACPDLGRALTDANRSLYQTDEVELFVTAFVCVLDTRSGRLTYANAGHNPAWIRRGDGGHEWLVCDPERIIAAFPEHGYTEHEAMLGPGEGMLLYTDGITEAVNAQREFFGVERLEETIGRVEGIAREREGRPDLPRVDVRQALEFTANQVELFAMGAPQSDDMTMLAFAWGGPES